MLPDGICPKERLSVSGTDSRSSRATTRSSRSSTFPPSLFSTLCVAVTFAGIGTRQWKCIHSIHDSAAELGFGGNLPVVLSFLDERFAEQRRLADTPTRAVAARDGVAGGGAALRAALAADIRVAGTRAARGERLPGGRDRRSGSGWRRGMGACPRETAHQQNGCGQLR